MSDAVATASPRARSLRFRLLVAGAIGILLAAPIAALGFGAFFERAAIRAFDHRLDAELDRLVALAVAGDDRRVVLRREPSDEVFDRVFSGWYWSVGEGAAARHSRSTWDTAVLDAVAAPADGARVHARIAGPRAQQLRAASQVIRLPRAAEPVRFTVAGDIAQIASDVRAFRWFAGGAVAAIAALLLVVLLVQVHVGLRPLRRLARTLARVRAGDETRFALDRVPIEVAPLAGEINALLDDHDRRVARARHAAQDLAHALKTPLAALSLAATDGDARNDAAIAEPVARMRAAIERHLAGNLAVDSRRRTPVAPVVDALVATLSRVHAARAITYAATVPQSVRFAGAADDLEEMLGNLLDNAGKWAKHQVTVGAAVRGDGIVVTIDDDGPGMDDADLDAAMRRGVRLDERAPGSGLGLDIVAGIASSHGGALALSRSDAGGLRATLVLPGDHGA